METLAPVVALNPDAGLHTYEVPPLAFTTNVAPMQQNVEVMLVVIFGKALTVTVTVCVVEQLPLVPVTV